MKKIILLHILVIVLTGNLFSQEVDETKDYIYTKFDEIKYANKVTYKKPFLGSGHFLVDSIKYKMNDVKFYKNMTGFHANTFFYPGLSGGGFAERVSKGKINLFNKEVSGYNPGHMGPNGMMMGGGFYGGTIQYYNKGFGPLKKAKYRYLVNDLADNQKSMEFLAKYKKRNNTTLSLFIGGAAVAVIGLVGFIKKTDNIDPTPNPNTTGNSILMGAGVGTMLVGSFISMSGPDYIQDAIDEYNKE